MIPKSDAGTAAAATPVRVPWLEIIRQELAPFAGRGRTTLRITFAVVLATALTLYIQIPFLEWLPPYLCVAISKETKSETVTSSVAVMLAIVFAVFFALGTLHLVVDPTWLRITALAIFVFGGFYLGRVVPALEDLAHDFAILMAIVVTFPDVFPYPGEWGPAAFWCIPMGFIGGGSAIVAALLFPPKDPFKLLLAELGTRLKTVQLAAERRAGVNDAPLPADAWPIKPMGISRSWQLLGEAHGEHPELQQATWDVRAVVSLVDRLALLAPTFIPTADTAVEEAERTRLLAIAARCERIRHALARGKVPVVQRHAVPASTGGPTSERCLRVTEVETTLRALERAFAPIAGRTSIPPAKPPMVASGAWSNPIHVHFAVKGTLAALTVYGIYTLFGLQQIQTALVTCLIVAQTTSGSIMHKMTLRIAGASLGAVLAILSTVFLIPHVEGVVGVSLVVGAGVSVGAWVAAGSRRIAYAGWQIALAIFMMLLHGQGPSTDFSVLWYRLLGILLGNVAMGLVFTWVWPERASVAMWQRMASAMSGLGELIRAPLAETDPARARPDEEERRQAWGQGVDDAVQVMEQAVFEPGAYTREGRLALAQIREILWRGLSVFPVLDALSVDENRTLDGLPATVRNAIEAYYAALSSALDELAARLAGETAVLSSDVEIAIRTEGKRVLASIDALSDSRLRSKLAGYRALYEEGEQGVLDLLRCGRGIEQRPWAMPKGGTWEVSAA